MNCIFDFGYHAPFCPCALLTMKDRDIEQLVCDFCERRLRCLFRKYECHDTFEDFLTCQIDIQLHNICNEFPDTCGYELTHEEFEIVNNNLTKICDANMTYG